MESSESRWTCEACGCNTNQQSDTSCTICGTSNSGPAGSILRRGVGAAYAARAGWFARGLSVSAARRGLLGDDIGLDDEDIWDSVVDGVDIAANNGDDPESAMESLAMHISSLDARSRDARGGLESSRQRMLEAGRAFSQSTRDAQRINPDELMQVARRNSERYQPFWREPTQISRSRESNGIRIGTDDKHLAHVPNGASEGRAIRAEQPIPRPRVPSSAASNTAATSTAVPAAAPQVPIPPAVEELPRRAFGFRVAFDHPNCEKGGNMGGCYLVGVTTASFSAYNESNGLHHSPWFWGVEDGANKYEGSRYSQGARGRRVSSANLAVELGPQEVPMNANNVLFGSREVVTVICDLDSRTLTFWRDETSLGTLVVNLPRGGNLYPVAVPFNSGVSVAITGLGGDPLRLLDNYAAEKAFEQARKEEVRRKELAAERSLLLSGEKMSDQLVGVLRTIFSSYCEKSGTDLSYTAASRLWYRSGMKQSYLNSLVKEGVGRFSIDLFLGIVEKAIEADVSYSNSDIDKQKRELQVGDKVELVKNYARFLEEPGGPLQPGDRGTVVELQSGQASDRRSVRVYHSGRRWWYPTKAVVSEKTGLIDSSGVWFVRRLLRAHGYDHRTLKPLSSGQLSVDSMESGDLVMSAESKQQALSSSSLKLDQFGRLLLDTGEKSSVDESPDKVSVQYANTAFVKEFGMEPTSSSSEAGLQSRNLPLDKLAYASPEALNCPFVDTEVETMEVDSETNTMEEKKTSISERLQAEIEGLSQLERPSIDNLVKECRKNSETLSRLFANGLPEALLSAMDVAERQMNSLEPREDLSERIAAVGGLATTVADLLFFDSSTSSKSEKKSVSEDAVEDIEESSSERDAESRSQNLAASLQQRRSVLMSLVSRARRTNSSYFHGMGGSDFARDIALGQVPPPFGGSGAIQPFVFGASGDNADSQNRDGGGDFDDLAGSDVLENSNADGSEEHVFNVDDSNTTTPRAAGSFLDGLLRCRVRNVSRPTSKKYGASQSLFARQLVAYGILSNDLEWTKAAVESSTKRGQVSVQRGATVLRDLVDEQGLPILRLAILFGCSPKVLKCLVSCGAQVDAEDVRLAALTGQHLSLSFLLRYRPVTDGEMELESCSDDVKRVLDTARARQDELDKKMKADGGSFVSKLLERMIAVCLVARRLQSPRLDTCSRSIADVLVGNALLLALQDAQSVQGEQGDNDARSRQRNDSSDQTGRFSVEETLWEMNTAPKGMVGSLPVEVLGKCFLGDSGCSGGLLQLAEDFLCSKEQTNVAAGLSLVTRMLARFPQLRSSPELARYGISHLIAFHDEVASERITRLLSSRSRLKRAQASPEIGGDEAICKTRDKDALLVRCPNHHVAVLHITRHSSFRCDLCGSGVERGRPMHGCRDCDWDACEACMDQAESGLVKCETIRQLVAECRQYLPKPDESSFIESKQDLELKELSLRLLRKDGTSVKELASYLNTPGKVTFHQFLGIVMPALYTSCVSQMTAGSGSNHRTKKARMLGTVTDPIPASDDVKARHGFCDAVVRCLIGEVKQKRNSGSQLTKVTATETDENEFKGISELVRRLQQVISLHEDVAIFPSSFEKKDPHNGSNELQCLKKAITLCLAPSQFENHAGTECSEVKLGAEPLLVMKDIESQILRAVAVHTPEYVSFCNSLATGRVIIVERAESSAYFRVARVISYDKYSGAHKIAYAPKWLEGMGDPLYLTSDSIPTLRQLNYTDEALVVLAAREYFIIDSCDSQTADVEMADINFSDSKSGCKLATTNAGSIRSAVGQRVESNVLTEKTWSVYTLRGLDEESSLTNGEDRFVLVSDEGLVYKGVKAQHIRSGASLEEKAQWNATRRSSEGREALNQAFPFLSPRPSLEASRTDARSLKRTWSALSLATHLQPVDLNPSKAQASRREVASGPTVRWRCKFGDEDVTLIAAIGVFEEPVKFCVRFSPHPKMPCVPVPSSGETTLIATMRRMHENHPSLISWPLKSECKLYFSLKLDANSPKELYHPKLIETHNPCEPVGAWTPALLNKRSRSLLSESPDTPTGQKCRSICRGLDEACTKSMELLDVLSRHIGGESALLEKDHPVLSIIANPSLSRKLAAQLNDPVSVVGGALPEWCTNAPTFAPSTFSYDCRRKLLERVAFGVSRGVFKQQEAKVNVGRYRQRMAALRARAVELVGEAFSGGAEDPTALQLQADELYGMEEALATRVRAAFRAVKWQEHSLQVAKAAVRRDHLLADAALVMDRYSTDNAISRRRLEIRFDGESGFDAASGDEAGVTRGFYADVAEALLCSETVAGVYTANSCPLPPELASLKESLAPMQVGDVQVDCPKIPLWIPDMDSTGKVVIPTPRADTRSALGVYPRPLPHYHPQIADVLARFRFIGRLFAAAVRDGFMFPLPLSAAFLRLVQAGTSVDPIGDKCTKKATTPIILASSELPRPGFLGGEIYAAETSICEKLDELDRADPPLSRHELEKHYSEIATDPAFAREALGKTYDCSFEDYFQEKTFVDPLDPTQGEDAAPLCPNGSQKAVTIRNVREWVALAKRFVLHDGVVAQAAAFRQGVEDFFCPTYLGLFTCEEWQRDICGVGDNVDHWDDAAVRKLLKLDGGKGAAEALVAVAAIGGEGGAALSRRFGPSSPTIQFLVQALLKATPQQRRQFLSFVTSVPIATPGRIEVVPIVSPSGEFMPMNDPTCLPRANTCARRLYLPKFEEQKTFDDVLWTVVREECRFKGFYEWRG